MHYFAWEFFQNKRLTFGTGEGWIRLKLELMQTTSTTS
ncbi:hypothetical protein S7335_5149 [Synechococcus sp. PCC 7335]|nr:hypothetical protein S7335_5149 [Synechococcus sp. PCC 7335]